MKGQGDFVQGRITLRLGKWIIVLIFAGVYALASAEVYRYVDEEGKVHYTDDLANVPAQQRPKAAEHGERCDHFVPEEEIERKEPEPENPGGSPKEDEEASLKSETRVDEGEERSLEQKLRQTGATLQEEFKTLMKERAELEKATASPLPPAERTRFFEKVANLNARIQNYEKRREAFNKEVEAYNLSIEKGGIEKEVHELR